MTPQAWLTWWTLAGCPKYIPEERMLDVPEEAFEAAAAHHGPGTCWWNAGGFGCQTRHGDVVVYGRAGDYTVDLLRAGSGPPRWGNTLAKAKYILAWALREGELL